MEKMKFEFLCPYLPYGLKVLSEYDEVSEIDIIHWSLDGFNRTALNIKIREKPMGFRGANLEDIKPILRPMSDLTKEIEHSGEKFVPIEKLYSIYPNTPGFRTYLDLYQDTYGIEDSHCEWVCIQKLIEWHFDIYSLIPAGLAIDINTLHK